MPGLGWMELFLLLLLAIVIIPPQDIPAFLRSTGALIGRLRASLHHATKILEEADLPSVSSIQAEQQDNKTLIPKTVEKSTNKKPLDKIVVSSVRKRTRPSREKSKSPKH